MVCVATAVKVQASSVILFFLTYITIVAETYTSYSYHGIGNKGKIFFKI